MNTYFEELSKLYHAIKDIKDIINEGTTLRNSDSKIDGIMNAIKEIDHNDLDDDTINKIASLLEEAIVKLYAKKFKEVNDSIGVNIEQIRIE